MSAVPLTPPPRAAGVVLPERLDRAAVPAVDAALERHAARGSGPIHLDLGPVRYVDSAGLGLLVSWHRRLLAAKRRLVLVGVDDYHRKLLEITRLDRDLIAEAEEAAAKVG